MRILLPCFFLTLFIYSPALSQNALNFDGIDDNIVTLNAGPQGTSPRTVECWVRTSFVGTQRVMVDWGDMSLGHRFTLNMINGLPRIEIGGSGMNGLTNIADGNWHHVAAVFNPNASASNYLLYVDGQWDIAGPLATLINTSSVNPVIIGRRNDGVNYWQGDIDEVRIWNTALTATEIMASYQQEICSLPSNLVYYYNFNQGQAGGSNPGDSVLLDQSIVGNHGTLLNFALNGSGSNWVAGQNLSTQSIDSINAVGCGSYTSPSGNNVWTTSGNYIDTITSSTGCDSILYINLTISSNSISSIVDSACGPYLSPSGLYTWSSSGMYSDTIPNSSGCDSIITVDLTVTEIDTSLIINNTTITANQTGASYQWLNCQGGVNLPIPGATSQVLNIPESGFYSVVINLNGCVDTSSCVLAFLLNLEGNSSEQLSVHPNPVNEELQIKYVGTYQELEINIVNIEGKVVYKSIVSENTLDVSYLKPGIYYIEVRGDDRILRSKFIKE